MDTLYCFTESGELRWEYTPDDRVHFGSGEYAGPWAAWNVFVVRTPDGFRIAWPVHHHTWWPSMLLLFDANGRRQTAFVHAGWIVNVASSHDGGRLFVTGSSNAREAYFLAVLDPARSGAVLPEPAGSPFACLDCGDSRPLQYYAFPRTEASRAAKFPGIGPGILSSGGRTLQINVHEGSELPSAPATLYEFTATGGGLIRANYVDSYWAWHHNYERLGHLAHRAQDCPERSKLIVSTWSADGWKTVRMPAGMATTTLPSLNR